MVHEEFVDIGQEDKKLVVAKNLAGTDGGIFFFLGGEKFSVKNLYGGAYA
jgi:hypothetical protein